MRAAATLTVLVAVLAGEASIATARAACPTGRAAWQVPGQRVCALAPKAPASGANLVVAATDAWLSDVLKPARPHHDRAMRAATVRAVLRAGHALALRATQLRSGGAETARRSSTARTSATAPSNSVTARR